MNWLMDFAGERHITFISTYYLSLSAIVLMLSQLVTQGASCQSLIIHHLLMKSMHGHIAVYGTLCKELGIPMRSALFPPLFSCINAANISYHMFCSCRIFEEHHAL